MPRLVRLIAVLSIVGVSAPAFACRDRGGVGIQLGHLFLGIRGRPCPQVVMVQAQPLPPVSSYQQQAPVAYSPPPMIYAQPLPVVQARVVPPPSTRPGFLAFKYMPGFSTSPSLVNDTIYLNDSGFAHSPGIEMRLTRWLSLRSDLEFRQGGRTWDILGVKVSLFPSSPVKPYASVSFGGNESYANRGKYAFGLAAAGGLDVFFGKHFFLEAEVRYRMTPGNCCSSVPALTGVIGGGVAFF